MTSQAVHPTCKSGRIIEPIFRLFLVSEEGARDTTVTYEFFWEIRERGPPSDDVVANAGDTYWTSQPFLLAYIKALPQDGLHAGPNLPAAV